MATPESAISSGSNASLPLAIGSLQEVTIEKLVYGGDGLAHIGSQAVFIPFAAVGDRLLVRITQLARNYARGVIERIITPSPARRTPPCQYFGVCGGCQLQHLDYEAQLKAKREFLHESLRRIGSIEWPEEIEVRAAAEFGYRSRAEVKIEREATGETRIGYYQAGTHNVCEIESCPLLLPAANRELQRLHTEKSLLPKDATRIYLTAGDDGVIVTPATGEGARVAEYDALGTAHQVIAGMSYEFGVRSFFQVNRLLVEELVGAAVGGVHGRTAFDLYAGVGLFSLQLSRHFNQVHAIEGNHLAAAHGLRNLRANGVGNVRYEATSVEAWLKHKASSIAPPDFVILDPPRAGAGRVVLERLETLSPRFISYVSCDPATLARDLRLLIDRGYALRSLVALDMFPQTFHLESVARLEKS
jgi:23S rRNA (uracil1939-C5)-methyltransferase